MVAVTLPGPVHGCHSEAGKTNNMEQDIELFIEQNKLIGQFMGVEPEIEYCVGNETGSCFHPKQCGYSWHHQQKHECERWISENKEYAERNGYSVQREEWWPWYNQDWNKLMQVVEKIGQLHLKSKVAYNPDLVFKVEIVNGYTQISGATERIFYNSSVEGSMINATYKAVYQFIQWQNNFQQ
jgi:hypothetical protein